MNDSPHKDRRKKRPSRLAPKRVSSNAAPTSYQRPTRTRWAERRLSWPGDPGTLEHLRATLAVLGCAQGAIQLNGAGGELVLDRSGSGAVRVLVAGRQWRPSALWGGRVGWRHVEVATGPSPAVAVDGRGVPLVPVPGGRLGARVLRGAADVRALVVAPADRADALLLRRLAALHARTRPGLRSSPLVLS
jgi:hypothetical protein